MEHIAELWSAYSAANNAWFTCQDHAQQTILREAMNAARQEYDAHCATLWPDLPAGPEREARIKWHSRLQHDGWTWSRDLTPKRIVSGMILTDGRAERTVVKVNRATYTVLNPWYDSQKPNSERTCKTAIAGYYHCIAADPAAQTLHFIVP